MGKRSESNVRVNGCGERSGSKANVKGQGQMSLRYDDIFIFKQPVNT